MIYEEHNLIKTDWLYNSGYYNIRNVNAYYNVVKCKLTEHNIEDFNLTN